MRLLRGVIGFGVIFAVFLGIGSVYMRHRITEIIRTRTASDSSVVVGRTQMLSQGKRLPLKNFFENLEQVGYARVSRDPTRAGEYSVDGPKVKLYSRRFQLPSGAFQDEQLLELQFSKNQTIASIYDQKFKQPVQAFWLEPEVLSRLGSSAERSSEPLQLSDFPDSLKQAVIGIEDERFYKHFGIDPLAITRAVITDVRSGALVQGGSTLTQQLAKNLLLSNERSLARKVSEAIGAVLIETAYTKDEVLELYLNEVFLAQEGQLAIHGFGAASQALFGKPVSALNLSEVATLAGMIKAPSSLNPRRFPERAKERRNIVLAKMLELGDITKADYETATKEDLQVQTAKGSMRLAPYFVDFIKNNGVEANLPMDQASAKSAFAVHTTLDPAMQRCANIAVTKGLEEIESKRRNKKPLQSALIALKPSSGEILAWVGGRDYSSNQYDRASMAKRQPGSLFKPFVYLTALDGTLNNYRVARTTSLLDDEPLTLELPTGLSWEPQNYDRKYRGKVTLRDGLAHSLNIPTVNLALKVGINYVARTAELLGLGEDLKRVPSLALGSVEVTPLQIARAYGTIANGGIYVEPSGLSSITEASSSSPVFSQSPVGEKVCSADAVFVLTSMMQSVIESGTGNGVRQRGLRVPLAGKTGTSNDSRDAWFSGFTPELLAVVWVGYDDNTPTGLTGATGAIPIWSRFMSCALEGKPETDFSAPQGVVYRSIDLNSGLLNHPDCPQTDVVTEVFVEGTEPVTSCLDYYPRVEATRPGAEPESFDVLIPPSRGAERREREDVRPRRQKGGTKSIWDSLFG